MRRLNREKNKNAEEENKKASIFIKSNAGAEDNCYIGEMRNNLYNELKDLKVSIKHQMSVGISALNKSDFSKDQEEKDQKIRSKFSTSLQNPLMKWYIKIIINFTFMSTNHIYIPNSFSF